MKGRANFLDYNMFRCYLIGGNQGQSLNKMKVERRVLQRVLQSSAARGARLL